MGTAGNEAVTGVMEAKQRTELQDRYPQRPMWMRPCLRGREEAKNPGQASQFSGYAMTEYAEGPFLAGGSGLSRTKPINMTFDLSGIRPRQGFDEARKDSSETGRLCCASFPSLAYEVPDSGLITETFI